MRRRFVAAQESSIVPQPTRRPCWSMPLVFALLATGCASGDKTASVLAFRVQGADSAELVDVFKETADAEADPLVWHPETISGKDVEVADPNEDFPTPIALYPTGEVMYFVSSSDQAVLEAVLAKLP